MSHDAQPQFPKAQPQILDALGLPAPSGGGAVVPHADASCGSSRWSVARRSFVVMGLGFLAACAAQQPTGTLARAKGAGDGTDDIGGGAWGADGDLPPARYARPVSPTAGGSASAGSGGSAGNGGGAARPSSRGTVGPEARPVVSTASIPKGYDGKVIPRSSWTPFRPDPKIMERMPSVTRITVHHEGNGPFFGTSAEDVKARLVNVLNGERGVGHRDIAYHFVIDPAGRVWEARDIRYEGRHTRNNYDANLGVMCLGNFEEQRIPAAQLAALEKFLKQLQAKHRVPRKRVYTHQELSATLCPGKDLQKKMGTLRSRLS